MVTAQVRADAFFSRLTHWRAELLALREILRGCDLVEDFKWSSPVYTHQGGNIAIIWGFKDRAALGFFRGVLLSDPDGLLAAPGPNSRSSRMLNFTDAAQITDLRPAIEAFVAQAVELEASGAKPDLPKDDLDYPEELVARLDEDDALRTAFGALTPGRQRGWVLHFSTAKQAKTRLARIEKAAPRILDGKGMHDR
ncbi:Uncharacterized conserved protein YdeI, YjbR/CyaY-like superfamily, DUF1801 family [Paracoccus isoporae]|uniref:Uncharacterized conserved protein YdeI, YjbR/CyaY-like superfamily, DUF1801 family n=1 Tax=Paracoccus isoporae TaxID=591205 RepID=A0A1G7CNB2_9RHOB|nr:YdeI/OmpD-associated family protein [Paracoccus isoporae]SDE40260.1 Uncharacterized conserved protein YdeI, YjbR/CyaY-like superfamily, DUF1801 family [Paracoccus isoporae]